HMEWVEFTARTVEEAKEMALDRLGVAADDADFEVLSEPKPGLFGRLRGEARVRARVRPTQARQKVERRERRPRKSEGGESARPPKPKAQPGTPRPQRVKVAAQPKADSDGEAGQLKKEKQDVTARQVGDEARKFIDELVAAFDFEGTTELIEDGDDLEIRVHGENLGLLVGPRGTTLQAVQDLARVASQRRLGDHDTRLRVDIGGYRQRRKEALDRFAVQMAEEVKESGIARVLEPMSSADRKIVHDALSGISGISTRSEGDDPYRRVVITPGDE
ncbi:MAG TPA: RNA-binding cell elongation regulator Jag/EloR, partial [Ilumatobacteraceae bacterium]|nr:RNA-binding cell elongation regulator Jag/EloR [Ilumatobacteraceae bacterium]